MRYAMFKNHINLHVVSDLDRSRSFVCQAFFRIVSIYPAGMSIFYSNSMRKSISLSSCFMRTVHGCLNVCYFTLLYYHLRHNCHNHFLFLHIDNVIILLLNILCVYHVVIFVASNISRLR